jgi:RNA methyltransferase, TrmH family
MEQTLCYVHLNKNNIAVFIVFVYYNLIIRKLEIYTMFKILTKNQEKFISSLYRRKKRYEHGLCICEGLRACQELYQTNKDLIEFAVLRDDIPSLEFKDIDLYTLPKEKFEKLSATVKTQGILFIAKIPPVEQEKELNQDFYLLLDRIADPGNFGTILRTASAIGLKEIWYSAGTVDPFSEKTIRSALAAQFRLKFVEYTNINNAVTTLKERGVKHIYRTEPSGGESCFKAEKLFNNSAIIFGNEAGGLDEIENTIPLNIPMPGKFESLNVAQAVTVILFEYVRRNS